MEVAKPRRRSAHRCASPAVSSQRVSDAGAETQSPPRSEAEDENDRAPVPPPQVSEHQANLAAVSPECRDLYVASSQQRGDGGPEEEAPPPPPPATDPYWAWDQARQQWVHEEDNGEVVWFPEEFS
ncbi:hypothetical protein F4780DRAFT_774347 [Xylariomycetidae sp. FL0641]|nr:hypothetical protein F4780DRAFT_784912 [Xylariomycetidae sp. FL0641]KAI0026151.1 hypothetical protein F4780DRAFT_774347 [Xylariomycetidae sp. FL0641]